MIEKYRKIIDSPRPVSKKHPQMSIFMRSAQFAPYAALTGYDSVVRETARLTDRRIELDEYEVSELNRKLLEISENGENILCSVTYFIPDKRKNGGRYVTETDGIKKVDSIEGVLITESGVNIPISEILSSDEV